MSLRDYNILNITKYTERKKKSDYNNKENWIIIYNLR